MRPLAPLLLLALLAACNKPSAGGVSSTKPLYAASDAGAPGLRPGLWTRAQPDCAFDEAKPLGAWPECAEVIVVRSRDLLTRKRSDPTSFFVEGYVLAAGQPRILQLKWPDDPDGDLYFYEGLRPLAFDSQGRIVRAARWRPCPDVAVSDAAALSEVAADAGLEASDAASDSAAPAQAAAAESAPARAAVADRPLPRGVRLGDAGGCQAITRDGVRAIVIQEEPPASAREIIHWVRDAET